MKTRKIIILICILTMMFVFQNQLVASSSQIDDFVSENDNDKQSIEQQELPDNLKSSLRNSGDAYDLEYVNYYGVDLSTFNKDANGYLKMYKINNYYVYCIEYGKDVATIAQQVSIGDSIYNSFDDKLKDRVSLLSAYATNRYLTTNNPDYLYAGQINIWSSIDSKWKTANTNTSIQSELDELNKLAQTHYEKPSFLNSDNELIYNPKTKLYETYLVDSNNVNPNKLYSLAGTYGDYKVSSDGKGLKITTSKADAKATTITNKYSVYRNGVTLLYDSGQDLISGSTKDTTFSFDVHVKAYVGSLEIFKTGTTLSNDSSEHVNLEGVTFTLSQNNKVIYTLNTDSNGQARLDNIIPGTYVLSESSSKEGYLKIDDQEVVIKEYELNSLNINNEIMTNEVNILKLDDENNPLAGAKFNIRRATLKNDVDSSIENYEQDINNYEISSENEVVSVNEDGSFNYELISDESGHAKISALKYGTYALIESSAPEGYIKDEKLYLINVNEDKKIINITVSNLKIRNKIVISKLDSDTQKQISGATLVIKDNQDTVIAEFVTTDTDYELEIPYGLDYTLCETKAPEGYVLNEKCVSFDVTESELVQNLSISNQKISNEIVVRKTDLATGEEIEGAKLVIYDKDKNKIAQWTSDGSEHLETIMYGQDYAICEELAPQGYERLASCVKFDVSKDGVRQDIKIENKLIAKINETGNQYYVAAVIFNLSLITAIVIYKRINS